MDIGKAIREIRKTKGYKQAHVASRCGISANAMNSIELNKAFPQKKTLNEIARVLEVPVSYILLFSITDNEVSREKKGTFRFHFNQMKDLLIKE